MTIPNNTQTPINALSADGANNNDVILNNGGTPSWGQIPVVQGDFPVGFKGLASLNNVSPSDTIDMTAVKCNSSDLSQYIEIPAQSLNITNASDWASGVVPSLINATFHVWATPTRYYFDDSTGSNITGAKRRVGSFITDSSSDIIPFTSYAFSSGSIKISYNSGILDVSAISSTTRQSYSISVPQDIEVSAFGYLNLIAGNGTDTLFMYKGNSSILQAQTQIQSTATIDTSGVMFNCLTNNFAQVDCNTLNLGRNFEITTIGYIDERNN